LSCVWRAAIMICIHCDGDTKVTNSRLRKRSNQVWRRRQCLRCKAVFTTDETVHYETAWTVKDKTGSYQPFMPDKLLLSLYRSLQHRSTALSDATELSQTIIKKLRPEFVDSCIESYSIAQTAQVALNRFDKAASTHYDAYHQRIR